MGHRFDYRWTLKDAGFTKDKGKVFSCFACGGGSTMGYKLAGFDVIGCNEIDPRMNEVYVTNHHPRHNYLMDIRDMVKLAKAGGLPGELYRLDVLDGSPPCSSFSICGERETGWGKEKKFREGQAKQVLDTLFFDFIELAGELRPKIVVAGKDYCIVFDQGRYRNNREIILCSSFPEDFDFCGEPVDYICGMSVPPVMMAQVACRIYEQWLKVMDKEEER